MWAIHSYFPKKIFAVIFVCFMADTWSVQNENIKITSVFIPFYLVLTQVILHLKMNIQKYFHLQESGLGPLFIFVFYASWTILVNVYHKQMPIARGHSHVQ